MERYILGVVTTVVNWALENGVNNNTYLLLLAHWLEFL